MALLETVSSEVDAVDDTFRLVVVAASKPAPPMTLNAARGTTAELVAVAPMSTWLVVVPSRTPEPLKNAQLNSVPDAPASTPQEKPPLCHRILSTLLGQVESPAPKKLPDTVRSE